MIFDKYKNSIKTRLIINVIFIHAILMALIVFDMLQREKAFMMNQLLNKGEDLTTILASSTASALLNNDLVALNELISELDNVNDYYMVFILDKNGKVRASKPKKYFNYTLTDEASKTLIQKVNNSSKICSQTIHNELVDSIAKVYVNDAVVGYVRTILNSRTLSDQLIVMTTNGIYYILAAIFIGAIFVWFSVRRMTANLNRLTHAAHEIANRNFNISLPDVKQKDELALMINAFRVMQSSLQSYITTIDKNEKRLTLALEGSSDGLWDWNLLTGEMYLSPRYKEMLGYEESEFNDGFQSWKESLYKDDAKAAIKFVEDFLQSDTTAYEQSFRMIKKDGTLLPVLSRAKKVYNKEGKAVRLIGTHVDMTEINRSHQFLQNIIDGVEIPIFVHNREYAVILQNRTAKEFLASVSKSKLEVSEHHKLLKDALEKQEISKTIYTYLDTDNRESTVELSLYPVVNEQGEVESIIETIYDITTLIRAQDSLKHQAEYDSLTNLPNRILFNDRLQQSIKHAQRYHEKIALLFLDLDNFKQVNDSLGHDFGDKLLINIANILEHSIRESDTVARLGGDEFTIILDKFKNSDILVDIIQKIIKSININHIIRGKEIYTSFSIGVSIYPDDGEDTTTLLKNADTAMYKAKALGKNSYQFYTADMTDRALERMMLETNLRQAVQDTQLEVYYQPQVNAKLNKVIGLEALIRWKLDGKFISPEIFIPLAEEIGLITQIDVFVLTTAVKDFINLKKAGKDIEQVSVNISTLDFTHNEYINSLHQLLQESSFETKFLEIEITESQIMKDSTAATKQLQLFKEMGIKLAIDDFGTGYSSLAYLKQLPISRLKIDKSFIDDIESDKDDQEIIKTIIAMAQNLNLNVIAEGVEDRIQKEFLLSAGCHEIQGYYYHKPMPYSELIKVLPHKVRLVY